MNENSKSAPSRIGVVHSPFLRHAMFAMLIGSTGIAMSPGCLARTGNETAGDRPVGEAASALSGTSFIWVDSIATLRGTTGSVAGQIAVVENYSAKAAGAPSDGGGGVFYWDASTSGEDGGTIIVISSGGGRWVRIYSEPLSVKWFGAKGDATTPDQAAINAAVNAAALSGSNGGVYFPTGTYRLTSTIHADHDNLVLTGGPSAILLVDPPAPGSLVNYPEGVLVNQNSAATTTHRVVIQELTFQVKGGSDNTGGSAAVVQLNNCADCIVRNVRMVRDAGVAQLPAGVDGIVMGIGSTGGLIQGCTVDGIAKAGIYVPPNSVGSPNTSNIRIDTCEVKNLNGAIGATGISISAEHVVVSNCQSHNNLGSGLLIQTVELSPPRAPTDIQIIGGHYDANHVHGIDVNTAYAAIPNNIQMADVNASYNFQNGIMVENATNVVISSPTLGHNLGAGMSLGSAGAARVQITNPTVFDNGQTASSLGIGISPLASSITITGGRLYDDQTTPTQLFGIQLLPGGSPSNIRILDVECNGANNVLQNAFVVTSPNGAEASSGRYRLEHAGSPVAGSFSAPPGSQYVDTTAGVTWVKTAGTGSSGWKQIVTQ